MTSTQTIPVDPSNAGAHQAWDGGDGDYWADNEAIFDDSVARYDPPFLSAAAIAPTDRVLDIGCGNGLTTRHAARRAIAGSALGIDLSSRMLERARQRATEEGVTNAAFLQADAQIHPFDPGSFDVAISRTAAMFFGDPVAAFTNIARALRPAGRLTLLVWQPIARNHWIRDFLGAIAGGRDLPTPPPGTPGPFSLADPDHTRAILTSAGFADITFDGVEEPMYFGPDTDTAYRFVRGLGVIKFLLEGLPVYGQGDPAAPATGDPRTQALAALRATIDAHETSDGVLYPSAAWIITAQRS
jgi:SAM-dependent methyltransferase